MKLTKELIEQKCNKLRDELIAKMELGNKKIWWEPVNKIVSYWISADGYTHNSSGWDDQTSKIMINHGCVFRTKEEADYGNKLRACTYRLKKAFFEVCDDENGWIEDSDNWMIILYKGELYAQKSIRHKSLPSWMHCRTGTQTQEMVDKHSDDLLFWLNQ